MKTGTGGVARGLGQPGVAAGGRGAGEQVFMYRTGVEFLEATAESLQVLQEWIRTRPA